MVEFEYQLYQAMCRGCHKEKQCHDDAEQCDDFLEALERGEQNGLQEKGNDIETR